MYLPLNNVFIWEIAVKERHPAFFYALGDLLLPDDIIAFACYEPSAEAVAALAPLRIAVDVPAGLYFDSIAFNKDEYPAGEIFFIRAKSLADSRLCELFVVSGDALLFYDHVLGFRLGHPVLPLFMYHDSNTLDEALVCGHYTESDIKTAFGGCGLAYKRILSDQISGVRS